MAYLIDHPGVLRQYSARTNWSPSRPTGLTVLHTTEFLPTWTVAEQAAWLRSRTTPGCYHDIADTHGDDLHLVPYEFGAWQDGTGSNGMAVSIAFVCRTTDWPRMAPDQRKRTLRAGARAFARQQTWLRAHGYPTTPLRMVTKAESDRGAPGFIYHGHRDPARRTDPGITTFPFAEFIAECRAVMSGDNPEELDMDEATVRKIVADELDKFAKDLRRADVLHNRAAAVLENSKKADQPGTLAYISAKVDELAADDAPPPAA